MKAGFIGLGNVGSKLAGNLLAHDVRLMVLDLDQNLMEAFKKRGAETGSSPKELMESCDLVITCLPSPKACSAVMEGENGVLDGMSPGKLWLEMSTTDAAEVQRLGKIVEEKGGLALDCPVSGGCHRAATGNIAILAGGSREGFEKAFPILKILGQAILHSGPLGSASKLKVVTNYLATANLVSLSEALTTVKASGLDLATAYEAIRISSGNSFVHETESQVILNGSRDINFTMDLVLKDISLFQKLADDAGLELEISPLLISIFKDGIKRYGERAFSPSIIERLEDQSELKVLADGFPAEITDDEEKKPGYEVTIKK